MAADLTAFTEEWPPYNFAEKNVVKGIATDILQTACDEAKISCEIHLVPWARALASVTSTPNTVLYTTARKASREKDFLWIGPILPRTTWVYGKAGGDNIPDFKTLARHKIGVVRGEAPIQDLEAAGIPASAMMMESSNASVLKLLIKDYVEAMVDTEIGMAWNLRNAGLPKNTVTKLLKLSDDGAYYFAMNLKSDQALHDKLQMAVDKLRNRGGVEKIVQSYASRQH